MIHDMMQILVDNRESHSGLPEALKVLRVPIETRQLETGDVVIAFKMFTVGIEIKRKYDFSTSLFGERLHDQICRLYDNYDYPVLILEGFEWHRADEIMENLRKAIDTLNLRISTYVQTDQFETVQLIGEFVRLLEKGKFNTVRRPVILEEDIDPRVPILCALPHISKAMAYILLEKYQTLSNALEHLEEWSEVPRITDERVDKIKAVLNNRYGSGDNRG